MMTVAPAPDSRWRTRGLEARAALARAGAAAHRVLLAGEWTWLRILAWVAGLMVALIAAFLVWLYFLDWNTMRGPIARYASARLHRQVRILGNLDVHIFSWTPRVTVSGVTVANPDWAGRPQAADLPRLAFSFRLIPAILGDAVLPLVQLDKPDIVVVRRADGMTNWDFGSGNTGWNIPPIQRFLVREGHIRIDDRVRKLVFTGTVTSEERANGGGAAFTLLGDGTLNGNKFSANVRGGPLIHVDESKPYNFTAAVSAGATHIVAEGSIAHPFHLGQFSAVATIAGPNLSELYELTGLAMPQTAAYHVSGTLSRDGTQYRFRDFSGVIGSSDIHGNFTVDASGDKPFVRGAASSRVLDFKDLGNLFGGKSATAIATGRLLPDLPLHVERLRQMDADIDYDAGTIRSRDFPLRGLHTHIALRHAVLLLKPLAFQFAYGRLTGQLKIDASRAVPVTDVDARIRDLEFAEFVKGSPPPVEALLEAHAALHGSGNSVGKVASTATGRAVFVAPQGKFRKAFAELTGIDLLNGLGLILADDKSDTGLRCAVADFDAKDGVLRTRQLVFDTDPVRVEGKGAIDLSNETMSMEVTGKPKEFRIGRVRAPITLSGPLASPKIGIKPGGVIAQGGIALALGVLFPPAAILPFIDLGNTKDANCASLLAQATAQGTPIKVNGLRPRH